MNWIVDHWKPISVLIAYLFFIRWLMGKCTKETPLLTDDDLDRDNIHHEYTGK